VRQLINSLQYTTVGSDDDEVQLVSQAAQQVEAGRSTYIEAQTMWNWRHILDQNP